LQVNAANSTTSLLAPNATFTGTAVDTAAQNIASLQVLAISNVASAANGLQIQWSSDNSNWDNVDSTSLTGGSECLVTSGVYSRYFRVVYTNGSSTQVGGYFRLQTCIQATATQATTKDLPNQITSSDNALITHSVIAGKSVTGAYTDQAVDTYGNGQVIIGGAGADAFGRARVSEAQTLLDLNFLYSSRPELTQTVVVGTGSAAKTSGVSSVTLTTGGTGSTSGVDFQSKEYAIYEPGKSHLVDITGQMVGYKRYVRQQVGYFDSLNGVFFDMDGTSQGATGFMGVTIRSNTSGSAVDTVVLSTSWSIDKMDGTGPSGLTINWSYPQQFVIDMEWLGVGGVRFGIRYNDTLYYVHQFNFPNTNFTPPYMNTANLPLHWAVYNTSGSVATSTNLIAVCGAVISEAGNQYPGTFQFSSQTPTTATKTATQNVFVPLISIQPATTYQGLPNRTTIGLLTLEVYCTDTSNSIAWEMIYNPLLAGTPSFNPVNGRSSVNVDTAATGVVVTITGTSTSAGIMTITGSWTGGANNQYVGQYVVVSGYNGANTGNNSTTAGFLCTASAAGSLSVVNASGTNATTGSPVASSGIVVLSGFAPPNTSKGGGSVVAAQSTTKYPFTINAAGNAADIYTVAAAGISGSATYAFAELTWQEQR